MSLVKLSCKNVGKKKIITNKQKPREHTIRMPALKKLQKGVLQDEENDPRRMVRDAERNGEHVILYINLNSLYKITTIIITSKF